MLRIRWLQSLNRLYVVRIQLLAQHSHGVDRETKPTAWNYHEAIIERHAEYLLEHWHSYDFVVSQRLPYLATDKLFLSKDYQDRSMSLDSEALVVDTFQRKTYSC
jgi:hypothetical protein